MTRGMFEGVNVRHLTPRVLHQLLSRVVVASCSGLFCCQLARFHCTILKLKCAHDFYVWMHTIHRLCNLLTITMSINIDTCSISVLVFGKSLKRKFIVKSGISSVSDTCILNNMQNIAFWVFCNNLKGNNMYEIAFVFYFCKILTLCKVFLCIILTTSTSACRSECSWYMPIWNQSTCCTFCSALFP